MSDDLIELALHVALFVLMAPPCGAWIARVLEGRPLALSRWLVPCERALLRAARVIPRGETTARGMDGKAAVLAAVTFTSLCTLWLWALLVGQSAIDPRYEAVPPPLALNTAISFATNTNWQSYSGEVHLSPWVQMLGLTVQNFLSAALGISALAVVARGLRREPAPHLGNVYEDVARITLHFLLPLALVLALALVSVGVMQSHPGILRIEAPLVGPPIEVPIGALASQVAIKQLGSNGGGFYNANSAHPFENPNGLSNFLQCLAILVVPAGSVLALGRLCGDRAHARALFAAMLALYLLCLVVAVHAETRTTLPYAGAGIDATASPNQPGGNMEGKEVRFGPVRSALWAVATTATSNGSVNSMHDSMTPIGGLMTMLLMQLGEVVFGGVGSGVYGIVLLVLITTFVANLLIGRTPEFFGRKIGPPEIRLATLGTIVPPLLTLIGTGIASALPSMKGAVQDTGAHGFSEMLYAFSSTANNNGSAFAGLDTSGELYLIALSLCMLLGRLVPMIAAIAVAQRLLLARRHAASQGTLPVSGPVFVALLIGTIVLLSALTFFPALTLGPIAEALSVHGRGGAPR